MKICIFGVGAIGGFIGTRLAATGRCSVSAVARGRTLRALQEHGWRLRQAGALVRCPATATDDARALGPQDVVIIAVKGPAMPEVAASIKPLLGRDTVVVPAMNGVPWWFAHDVPALGSAPLESVDPRGRISAAIPFANVVGCVVHVSATSPEPGLSEHKTGLGLIVGETNGGESSRTWDLALLLTYAGLEATVSPNIRRDIWYKLWGNLTMNPVSALTGATIDRMLDDPLVREFCAGAMREAAEIGARIGCLMGQTPDDRLKVTSRHGRFKSSMLQDVEAGRPLEIDAIVGAVKEIGERLRVPTPHIDSLLGLVRLFARTRGLYPESVPTASNGASRGG